MASAGELTPPPAHDADDGWRPCASSSRTALRPPRERRPRRVRASRAGAAQEQVVSAGQRLSPWPPVWLMARPATNRRADAIAILRSTAWRKPASAPPASRAVVKPRRTISFNHMTPRAAMNETARAAATARRAGRKVHMAVDEAQRINVRPLEVDHLCPRRIDGAFLHGCDRLVANQHLIAQMKQDQLRCPAARDW